MGFLDKLLGRKPAAAPQTAPEPPAMPATDAAEQDDSHEGHDHDHDGHDHKN